MAKKNTPIIKDSRAQFRCILFQNGKFVEQKDYATKYLANTNGQKWASLNQANTYHVCDKDVLAKLYEMASIIHNRFIENGSLDGVESEAIKGLRSQYIIESGGQQMPEFSVSLF